MKKRDRKKNSHGAVTVFLTMVLVPCMIFTCAFGDVSRVQLSKAQAAATSDLALYSLMANYDEELKEWYGLVASCQDIDKFFDTTEKYFVDMMNANGIDGYASELFVSYLSALKSGDDITDFLQVEVQGETTVGPVDNNSALGNNPALMEDAIVEFMKYRGPIEITSNLIDRFRSLNVLGGLSDAGEDKPIVDAKTDAAEAEGAMLKELVYTYMAILNYKNYYSHHENLRFESFQNTYPEELKQIREDLKGVTELVTKYYFTDYLQDMRSSIPVKNLPYLINDGEAAYYAAGARTFTRSNLPGVRIEQEESTGEEEEPPEPRYIMGEAALNSLIQNYSTYIDNIRNAANGIYNDLNGIAVPTPNSTSNDVNEALYLAKVQNVLGSTYKTTIDSNADYLFAVYGHILMAERCELPEGWASTLATVKAEIAGVQRDYLSYSSASTDYERLMKQYADIAGALAGTFRAVNERTYEFIRTYEKASSTVGKFAEAVRNNYAPLYNAVEHQIEAIDIIVNGGQTTWEGKTVTVTSLDGLKTLVKEYKTSRDKWGEVAHAGTTEYAKSEAAEYDGESSSQIAESLKELQESDIDEMKTRLLNIRADLVSFRDALQAFKYGGTTIYNISGREALINAARTVVPTDVSQISPYLSQNAKDAAVYYQSLVVPLSGDIYTAPQLNSTKAGNHPDLMYADTTPELLRFLSESIRENDLRQIGDQTDQFGSDRGKYEEAAGKAAASSQAFDDKYLNDLGTDPGNNGHSAGGMGVLTAITSAVGAVRKIVSGNISEFRDQLYVCEYAMDMFSWSTYNNEGQYKLARRDGKSYTIDDYDKEAHGFPDYMAEWGGDKGVYTSRTPMLTKFINRSLTNKAINSQNNLSNLGEIEYILYGKSTNEKNLAAAYESIFVIREALNLVSGFQNFYLPGGGRTANAIQIAATGIYSMSFGIIPIPLVKCVAIGILATLESASDIERLKAGTPVALYKVGEEQWRYAIKAPGTLRDLSALFGGLDDGSGGKPSSCPTDENGLFYSDYMYIFLAMSANASGNYKNMLLRIGDLIEANMKKGAGVGEFDLGKSYVYFKLTAQLRVKPLFMTLPIVSSEENIDSGVLQENKDWCTYDVNVIRGYS